MAGGLGGLGGFGSVLGALGQSLLTSPRENPFQGLPAALQASAKDREHQAALSAMSTVAEKLGIPRELAASPEAMKLFIDHINQTKLTQLRQQAAQGISLSPPDEGGATSQPALSVPGVQSSSSGIPTTFNVAGGGLDGPGGLGGPVADATSRVRTRPGGLGATPNLPAFAAIQGGTPSGKIAGVISQAAERYGLDPAALVRTAQIESGLRPNAKNPTSSAGGLFQFINSTAKQYGLTNKFDPVASADAGARLMRDNADKLRGVLGRDPQPWELYLAHQQGSGGAAKLLSNPNASAASLVGADAVRLNGGSPGMTAQQFAGIWRKKFGDLPTASQNATGLLAAASGTTPDYAQADAQRLAATAGAPVQLASADPNMPLPSSAMQRVQAEAAARGIGQGGPGIGAESGPGIGQSGAPLNQVAAGRGRLTVPIPGALTPGANSLVPPRPPYTGSDPTTPAPVTAPAAPPPVSPPPATPPAGEGTNKTKAWAQRMFQYGMTQLALSNGDPVLMKQAEIILQRAAKYGDPSDIAKRVAEAGLTNTPYGRAKIADMPNDVIEKLLEQQVPGYVSPNTLSQQKFRSDEDERRWQHSRLETEFGATEEERRFRRKLDREKLANEIGHQTLQLGEQRASRKQQREIATESHAIQLTPPAQILGRALTTDRSAAETRAGLDAQQQQVAAEAQAREAAQLTPEARLGRDLSRTDLAAATRAGMEAKTAQAAAEAQARDVAAARAKYAAEVTGGAQAAEALVEPVRQAQQHLKDVVAKGGYGPLAAGPVSRALNAVVPDVPGLKPGHAAEVSRQKFDQAMATIGAAKAALVNKAQGGGNMSLTEQTLARADLAKLTSAEPGVAEEAFKQLNKDIDRALELDRRFGIHQGGQQQSTREGAATPAMSQSDIAQTLLNARTAIQAGKPRAAVIERLRAAGIDPGGL